MGILGLVTASGTRDAALASAGSKTTAAGAGVSVFGLVSSQEFISLAGVAIAVLGFGVTWYYKHKDTKNSQTFREREDARAQAEHELRMTDLKLEVKHDCEVCDGR